MEALEHLEEQFRLVGDELHAVWSDPANDPPDDALGRMEKHQLERDYAAAPKEAEAWYDMVMDTVEVRYALAIRRLHLAKMGLEDEAHLGPTTVKWQRGRLGVLLIITFRDRLAAIDFKTSFDAMFCPDSCQLLRAMLDPKWSVRRWLDSRSKAGRPWEKPSAQMEAERLAARNAVCEDFKRLRKLLYPTEQARKDSRERRCFTRQEVHDTLAALAAYKEGEPLPVELQVRDLDLENMTPLIALETLGRLQDQARRIADTKQFLPKSLGGGLSPSA